MALSSTRASLERLGAELSVVAWAFVLGALMRRSETIQTLAQGLFSPETPALLLIALIVYGILATVSIGGHPIVAASVLLAVLGAGSGQLTDTVLFASVVLGWGCSSMIGPAALNLMMTSLMFQVSRRSLIVSINTVLNVVFASFGIAVLTGINAWLRV